MKQLARYSAVGFELAASIGVGFFGGRFLDRHLGTHWIVWVGLALGCFAGFRTLFVTAHAAQKALDDEDAKDPGRWEREAPKEERDDDDRPS